MGRGDEMEYCAMERTEMLSRPSKGYICQLWDFRSLLIYRAKRAKGSEGRLLLAQAIRINKDIANCLGKKPSDIKKLADIKDLKKLLAKRKALPMDSDVH